MADLLCSLRRNGIRVWLDQGKLRYDFSSGEISIEDSVRIRLLEDRLAPQAYEKHRQVSPALARRPAESVVPLTFTQTAHWKLYALERRRSVSALTSATHLSGRLDAKALDIAVAAVVERHEALRTKIIVRSGMPVQEIDASFTSRPEHVDLTVYPSRSRLLKAKDMVETLILYPIDLAHDPLFRVWVLRVDVDDHLLVVTADHMISDAWSMSLLLRDLLTVYGRAIGANTGVLPILPVQFADYAIWQRDTDAQWRSSHLEYWQQRLSGSQRLHFRDPYHRVDILGGGWGSVPLEIDNRLTEGLANWCKGKRTTVAMGVLTAWSALLLRWCDTSDAVVQYQVNGRTNWKIRDAVGYFAAKVFLRVHLTPATTFARLLADLENERFAAYAHADCSRLESQSPALPFAANSLFNWIPNTRERELPRLARAVGLWDCRPMAFDYRALGSLDLDHEPAFLAFEEASGIRAEIQFNRGRVSERAVREFGGNLISFINCMLADPKTLVCAAPISDFN